MGRGVTVAAYVTGGGITGERPAGLEETQRRLPVSTAPRHGIWNMAGTAFTDRVHQT